MSTGLANAKDRENLMQHSTSHIATTALLLSQNGLWSNLRTSKFLGGREGNMPSDTPSRTSYIHIRNPCNSPFWLRACNNRVRLVSFWLKHIFWSYLKHLTFWESMLSWLYINHHLGCTSQKQLRPHLDRNGFKWFLSFWEDMSKVGRLPHLLHVSYYHISDSYSSGQGRSHRSSVTV